MNTEQQSPFEAWCIAELLGHKTLAGLVTETRVAGKDFFSIQIPHKTGETTTELFSPDAVYRLIPCTEETARIVSRQEGSGISLYDARQLLRSHDSLMEKLDEMKLGSQQPVLSWDDDTQKENNNEPY
jgi:hypothetical protein